MRQLNSSAITFLSALEDDIPSLIRIHMASFANDNSVRLMFKSKDHYETTLRDMLKAQISSPKFAVIMAITKDKSSILGWQACRFLGEDDSLEDAGASAGMVEVAGELEEQCDSRTLRSVLRENALRIQEDWMANKKYILLDTRTYFRRPRFLA